MKFKWLRQLSWQRRITEHRFSSLLKGEKTELCISYLPLENLVKVVGWPVLPDLILPNIRGDGNEGLSVGTNRQGRGNKAFKKWLDELVERLSHSKGGRDQDFFT